ncbi:putative hst3 protein [Eutypa lata UCREL1]|uniref:Putative hst3 protein n=1 Tax=Eutypa lata (strain UCR-EL1) TaxID=1287681 RepID=M7SSJ0_EUTLA|nr:putative hst3 protein [Eutypa lata UCREL1]
MPTVQVTSTTSELLQDVANALGKARKVVVVTGAGISTNTGIPDFRSENGLYSLIQAQFERAAADPPREPQEVQEIAEDESNDFEISDRPTKRRKVSVEPEPPAAESTDQEHLSHSKTDDQPPLTKVESASGVDGFRLRIDGNAALKQDVESSSGRFATSLRQKVREVQPTTTHHFIAQLRDVGKLARVYTQNIDEIEKKIGLSTDLRNGAGNKRRKSAKQQLLIESEKDGKENLDQPKLEDDSIINGKVDGNQPASQASEDAERAKPRSPDKGVECVFLHGSLHSLRCFVCDIVLYGEEHPQSDLISPIVQYDLSAGPDLLLVLGTSLRVHGLKVMVKEFAKASDADSTARDSSTTTDVTTIAITITASPTSTSTSVCSTSVCTTSVYSVYSVCSVCSASSATKRPREHNTLTRSVYVY